MKLTPVIAALATLLIASAATAAPPSGPAHALSTGTPALGNLAGGDTSVRRSKADHYYELKQLRTEALKLQKSDGGELTREHQMYLQAKLDYINGKYKNF